jgi:O-acetyl-ADP-ribose deacetylase (regulator of RNase III)
MAKIICGNLLEADTDLLIHQCNCVTNYPKGLAAEIFKKYPEADIYTCRKINTLKKDFPGTIKVIGKICNLFGQYYPGPAKYNKDSAKLREQWFKQCLTEIAKLDGIKSVAFPWRIGCGLAKGNWNHYKTMIDDFANQNPHMTVFIYKLK